MFAKLTFPRKLIAAALLFAMSQISIYAQINTEQVTLLGIEAMSMKDYLSAIQLFTQAISSKPALGLTYQYRAEAKLNLDDYFGAVEDATNALKRNPFLTKSHRIRGLALHRLGLLEPAIDDYQVYLDYYPESKVIENYRNSALQSLAAIKSADTVQADSDASNAAIATLPPFIREKLDSTLMEPMMTLSYYAEPWQYKTTSTSIKEVENFNNLNLLIGNLSPTTHQYPLESEDIELHNYTIDYRTGYLATHAPRLSDLFGRGIDYATLGMHREAAADFEAAAKLSPDFSLGWLMLGVSLWNSGDHTSSSAAEALEAFDRALAISPSLAIAWYDKGCIYADLKEYEKADTCFSHAISIDGEMGEAYYNRAYCRLLDSISYADKPKSADKLESILADLSKAGQLGIIPAYHLIRACTAHISLII